MVEAGGVSPSDFGRIEGADITNCPPRFLDLAPSLQGNYVLKVMPFPGGQGGLWPTWNLGVKLTLFRPGGQIMPNTMQKTCSFKYF